MSLKNYKAGLSLALLFHVIAIFALTKLHWSEISPNTSKVGWKESHVIQSYLYESKKHEPYKMEKGSNAQKNLKPDKLGGIHRKSQNHNHHRNQPRSHKATLKSDLAQGQYNQLLIALHNTIERNQFYPDNARLLGQRGKVKLGFELLTSGRLINIKILQSSGYELLDQAAMQAVADSSPFHQIKVTKTVHLQLMLGYK